jgi:hypothetical protein
MDSLAVEVALTRDQILLEVALEPTLAVAVVAHLTTLVPTEVALVVLEL